MSLCFGVPEGLRLNWYVSHLSPINATILADTYDPRRNLFADTSPSESPPLRHLRLAFFAMTGEQVTRRVYSAEELHRLRASCSQPKLHEAIEEHDSDDAELVKGKVCLSCTSDIIGKQKHPPWQRPTCHATHCINLCFFTIPHRSPGDPAL